MYLMPNRWALLLLCTPGMPNVSITFRLSPGPKKAWNLNKQSQGISAFVVHGCEAVNNTKKNTKKNKVRTPHKHLGAHSFGKNHRRRCSVSLAHQVLQCDMDMCWIRATSLTSVFCFFFIKKQIIPRG